MDNTFYYEVDGRNVCCVPVINFSIDNNLYCVYFVDCEDENLVEIYCGKVIDNELYEIEDEEELKLTNGIVNELIGETNGTQINIMYNGEEVSAELLDIIHIRDCKYAILSVKIDSNKDILVKKIIENDDRVSYVDIIDEDEKNMVYDEIRDIVDKEVQYE